MLDGLSSIHHDKVKHGQIQTDYLIKLFTSNVQKDNSNGEKADRILLEDSDITFTEG
jgi:hypothetical protein